MIPAFFYLQTVFSLILVSLRDGQMYFDEKRAVFVSVLMHYSNCLLHEYTVE